MEPTDPRDPRVVIAVWELRDPRESREPMHPRVAACVEASEETYNYSMAVRTVHVLYGPHTILLF